MNNQKSKQGERKFEIPLQGWIMNQPYELNFEYFQGPFEKLLGLIEEKKLEINQISLAEVTADLFK